MISCYTSCGYEYEMRDIHTCAKTAYTKARSLALLEFKQLL